MSNTLKLWPFDSRLTWEDKEDLLKYFGAIKVLPSKRCGNTDAIIAVFEKPKDCEYALKQLHQQDLGGGKRLIAVYDDDRYVKSDKLLRNDKNNKKSSDQNKEELKHKISDYEQSLSNISNKFNIKYPISTKLKYLYPPPSPHTLANITITLASVPKFYTQVLHLMNKMNLPVPFCPVQEDKLTPEVTEIFRLLKTIEDPIAKVDSHVKKKEESYSTSESEMESDENDQSVPKKRVNIYVKRKTPHNQIHISKKRKLELLKKTSELPHKETNPLNIEQVFECTDVPNKKLELNILSNALDSKNTEAISVTTGGFGIIKAPSPTLEPTPLEERESILSKFISDKDLLDNRVSESDWPILPVFKNYVSGEPSVKLYIKNLGKNSNEENLKYIYGRYIFWHNEQEVELFNIRLMKEGRMKGQAFVTFPSIEQATKALNETNGYILNDKPMVVMFGRVK